MSRSKLPELNGIVVVDKPAGMTSHDVVSRVRRLASMKRVGHGGTLDPFATGVLIVAVGRATRVLQYVQDSDKSYVAHVVLGVETDTCDVEGSVVSRTSPLQWPSREQIEGVVSRFVGLVEQSPPAYSAIKVGGRKLYERARAGEEVDVPVRLVEIDQIEICSWEPPDLRLEVRCGKGTYIRSLARDIGRQLGTGGYCDALRRTRSGSFHLGQAWSLDQLADIDLRDQWPDVALHPDSALDQLPAVILDRAQTTAWYHGRSVAVASDPSTNDLRVRVYGEDGWFLGIGTGKDGWIAPSLVFPAHSEGDGR